MRSLTPEMRSAIERAAQEEGIDPTFALAVAERESSFNPAARNSKTIRGLYQMRGDHRSRYGVGDSDDPYEQTKGWARFIKDVKKETAGALGRDPTDSELYAAHHFGGVRAGRMMKMDPATPVDQVFTPYERSINPHFDRAGTVGALNSTILADMEKRRAKFGGVAPAVDFASAADPAAAAEPHDFSAFGQEVDQPSIQTADLNMKPEQAASSAPDFSNFGVAP